MSFKYQVKLNDPSKLGGAADATLVYDLGQALAEWSKYIQGAGSLVVQLNIVQTSVGRMDGAPTSSFADGTSHGRTVYGPSSLYELETGSHVAGVASDMTIDVSPSYFQYLDLSKNMSYSSTGAMNKYNPVIPFMHEVMHGFGQAGFYTQSGSLPSTYESKYDTFLQTGASGSVYYVGSEGAAQAGGPVRVTSSSTTQNYYHFGNTLTDLYRTPSTVQDPLTLDLMNGIVLFYNYQYKISTIDLGVLKDLGYTVVVGLPPPKVIGTAGADTLTDGGSGHPRTMIGLGGNDTYVVHDGHDVVSEAAAGGTDRVATSVSYALGAGQSIETLTPTSYATTTNINLTGNELAQAIRGNAGANVIDGKAGSDSLTGGGGHDTFRLDTALTGSANIDRITDFTLSGTSSDIIDLAHAIFAALPTGKLSSSFFHAGTAATTTSQHVIYNPSSGGLFYDSNGSGSGGVSQFATLSPHLALTASSFHVS